MKIVILAGGKGTRIASVNNEIPKPMILVNGKPVLEYQVELAKHYGFTEFIFIIGHLGSIIRDYFDDGKRFGVNITYYEEKVPLGTAGALADLVDFLTEDFFVFYGDTIMDIALDKMLEFHSKNAADATLYVHPNDHPYDSDLVSVDSNSEVRGFYLKPHKDGLFCRNIVNAALYILSPKILGLIVPGNKTYLEKDIFSLCLVKGYRLFAYQSSEYIKDMGTPERYEKVCSDQKSGKVARLNRHNKRPAIFLDRDGVINYEINLLHDKNDFKLIPGVSEAIRLINQSDYLVVVVTNQPVIARNLCSLRELQAIHEVMETELGRNGAFIDGLYFCPHHPDSGYPEERKEYKIVCDCRKPKPGMLLKAASDLNVDMANSLMIGDNVSDIEAGKNAGVKQGILIEQNAPDALLIAVKEFIKV